MGSKEGEISPVVEQKEGLDKILQEACLQLIKTVAPWVENPPSLLEQAGLLQSKEKFGTSSSQYGFDIKAEDALRSFFQRNYPGCAFFGEEKYWGNSDPGSSRCLVVADCVDGSTVLARMAQAGISFDRKNPLQEVELDGEMILVDTDAVGSHIAIFDRKTGELMSAIIDYAEGRVVLCNGEEIRIFPILQDEEGYKLGEDRVFTPPDLDVFEDGSLVVLGAFATDIRKRSAEEFMQNKEKEFELKGRYIGATTIARVFAEGNLNQEMRSAVEQGGALMMSFGKGRPLYEILFLFPFFQRWGWVVYKKENERFSSLSYQDVVECLIGSPGGEQGDTRIEFIAGPEGIVRDLLDA